MSKILICDDLPTEVELMKQAVTSLGHTYVVVTDGEAACESAKKEKPDLILLDVVLPKMDGFQACRKIKKDTETSNIPVILVTSKGQESDKFWGMKQGASGYITKPFQPSELAELITKTIR